MITEIRQLYACLAPPQQREMLVLSALTIAAGISEFVTIGALVPFLSALVPSARSPVAGFDRIAGLLPSGANNVVVLASFIVIAAAFSASLKLVLIWRSERFGAKMGNDLVKGIYRRAMREDIAAFDTRNTSEIIAAVDKVQGVEHGFVRPLQTAFTSAVVAACLLLLPLYLMPALTLAMIGCLALLYGAVSMVSVPNIRRYSRDMSKGWDRRTRLLRESLGAKREIMLAKNFRQFEIGLVGADRKFRDAQASNNSLALSPRAIFQAAVIIALVSGAAIIAQCGGEMTAILPLFVGIAIALQRVFPLAQAVWNGTVEASGNCDLVRDVMRLRQLNLPSEQQNELTAQGLLDQLECKSVDFAYSGGPAVLGNIDLMIKRRDWIGISGASGSGKSTLLDLLAGFHSPTAGALTVDGEALVGSRLRRWQCAVGYVREASFLIDGSIADNICFGEAPSERCGSRMQRAIEIVQLSDFVARLQGGAEAEIGEGGIKISAGQRQRIAIARALYANPAVLILDEATNAIDLDLEKAMFSALSRAVPDLTLILVTHRTQSLRHCDRHFTIASRTLTERAFQAAGD